MLPQQSVTPIIIIRATMLPCLATESHTVTQTPSETASVVAAGYKGRESTR